jgi:hypothetical protein
MNLLELVNYEYNGDDAVRPRLGGDTIDELRPKRLATDAFGMGRNLQDGRWHCQQNSC